MMTEPLQMRTHGGRWGAALCLAALLGLMAGGAKVAQAEGSAAGQGAAVAERWEDLLLLEAAAYLRLSPGQLRQAEALAGVAGRRLAQLREQEAKSLVEVERIARVQQEALLAGGRGNAVEQSNALLHREAMGKRRKQAEDALVETLAPQLRKILSRDQVLRAYLLTRGEVPEGEAASPALLDPEAGFVLGGAALAEWRDAEIQRALAGRYSAAVMAALQPTAVHLSVGALDSGGDVRAVHVWSARTGAVERAGTAALVFDLALTEAIPEGVDPEEVARAREERTALEAHWESLPQRLVEGASEAERIMVLRHLTRRMFLSSRIQAVLKERLAAGG